MFSDAAARTAPFGGDLLSVICHRGGASGYGHFISYHKVTGQWYRNDDSRKADQAKTGSKSIFFLKLLPLTYLTELEEEAVTHSQGSLCTTC